MKTFTIALIFLLNLTGFSQETLTDLLNKYNNKSVPYISVQELAMPKTKAVILDTREQNEFKTSHIKDAVNVGYDNFNLSETTKHLKNTEQLIVVYCSLGIRSEVIGEKLKKAGYHNVYNLYGGIFEWKNNNFDVYDHKGTKTENVHTFSKEWSHWLKKGTKIYEQKPADSIRKKS